MEYIPNTKDDQQQMLAVIGVPTIEHLLTDIPSEIRLTRGLQLPPPLSEPELKAEMFQLSEKNADLLHHVSFLGAGAYDHHIPSVVGHLAFRSEFYTSYTPYQAEMSQGLLQSIYEFQTMISELTGMEAANASLYDGGTALAEAALMAIRVTKRRRILVSRSVNPWYRQVLRTYLSGLEVELVEIPLVDGATDAGAAGKRLGPEAACVLIQTPNFYGVLEAVDGLAQETRRHGTLLGVAADPVGLGLLRPPGDAGADIVVGEGQGLGNGLNFGGPYLGFFATRREYIRQMPGRVVGATLDTKGRRGFCLTLQTREQHIKRERATSNICTNEALAALASTIYLAALGRQGLRETGRLCLQKSHYLKNRLAEIPGIEPAFGGPFFKEFAVKTPVSPARLNRMLFKKKFIGGLDLGSVDRKLRNHWLLCVTEKRTKEEMDRFTEAVRAAVS